MKSLVAAAAGVALAGWLWVSWRRPEAPESPAARATRATVEQVLTTNGKVEALESHVVHARAAVQVLKVLVQQGDAVRRGQALAGVDAAPAREALARAQAQLEIGRADLALLERGGSAVELVEVDRARMRARLDQQAAEREAAILERLVEKKAATPAELAEQRLRVERAAAELSGLERRRQALLGTEDRQRVRARIREAEAALAQAQGALERVELRAPAGGVLYALELRAGAFVNAGDRVAEIGALDRVRVRVLVDEPELGQVAPGQPVEISWDALPGRRWKGMVERLPSRIEMAGTRSVGEALCTIENPERRLLPNVTVNADIRTGRIENALTIPREAVMRQGEQAFVLVVDAGGVVARQPVKLGIRDVNRVQVLEGLADNQVVLLPGEATPAPGQKVRPRVGT